MRWRSRQLRRRDLEAQGWCRVTTWVPTKCYRCFLVVWFGEFWKRYKLVDCSGEGEYLSVQQRCPTCYVVEVLGGANEMEP